MSYQEVRIGDEHAKSDVDSGIYTKHYEIKPTDTVIDIGAHVGYFTMWAAPRCKQVIAFEPEPFNYSKLSSNTSALKNVTIINAAVADYDALGLLGINPNNSGGHSLFREDAHTASVSVQVVNLGLFLKRNKIYQDFIKIDAESSELRIISSLFGVMCPMAIEIHSHLIYDSCAALLSQRDYKLLPETNSVGVCYAMPCEHSL